MSAPPALAARAMPIADARATIGFFCMVLGLFMAILDIQIVASSLAEIQAGLSASPDEASWIQSAYLIAEVVMIPLSGFLSRALSTRVLFVISSGGFTLMSLACALSWDLNSMILFRALQGFIGGGMIPTVFASSFLMFSPARRANISVVIGLVVTMAPTLGPILGGFLTAALSWHWLFLINIIPGLFITIAVYRFVDIDRPEPGLWRRFDGWGLLFMALFLCNLEYFLEDGPRYGWFSDRGITIAAMLALIGGSLFFWRVLTHSQPIVNIRAFGNRNFALGCLLSFVLGSGLYGAVYLIPVFLARVLGYNSLQIGTTVLVTGAFQFLGAPLSGFLVKKIDLRLMMACGLALFGTSLYLTATLTAQTGFAQLFIPQALRGLSLMMCFMPINMLALGTLSPGELKNASGLYNLTRNLGGAIGLALIGTAVSERLSLHWGRLAEQITNARPAVQQSLDPLQTLYDGKTPSDSTLLAWRHLASLVQREAAIMTYSDCFLLMAAAFIVTLLLVPLIRKPQHAPNGGH